MIRLNMAISGGITIAQRVAYRPSLTTSTNSGIRPPEKNIVNTNRNISTPRAEKLRLESG